MPYLPSIGYSFFRFDPFPVETWYPAFFVESCRYTAMRVIIENNNTDALRFAADYIVRKIKEFAPTEDKPFSLVLPNPLPSMKPLYVPRRSA